MKLLLILLLSITTYGSFWQECKGKIEVKKVYSSYHKKGKRVTTADILVNAKDFTCKGHSQDIRKEGLIQKSLLLSSLSITPKKGEQYIVLYNYGEGLVAGSIRDIYKTKVSSLEKWRLIKHNYTIFDF